MFKRRVGFELTCVPPTAPNGTYQTPPVDVPPSVVAPVPPTQKAVPSGLTELRRLFALTKAPPESNVDVSTLPDESIRATTMVLVEFAGFELPTGSLYPTRVR